PASSTFSLHDALPIFGGVEVVEVAPGDYVVAAPPAPATVAALTAWLAEHDLPLGDLRAGRQRLEDVYLRLTGQQPSAADPPGEADRKSTRLNSSHVKI